MLHTALLCSHFEESWLCYVISLVNYIVELYGSEYGVDNCPVCKQDSPVP